MLSLLKKHKNKPAQPPAARPAPKPALRSGTPSVSSSGSGSSSISSGERKVRFSDEPEVKRAASNVRSTRVHIIAGGAVGHTRPPRMPALPTVPSDSEMPVPDAGHVASPRGEGELRHRHREHREHRRSSAGGEGASPRHHHGSTSATHHGHQHRSSSRRQAGDLPPPEEVEAALGSGGAAEGQPGSLAECARLFHKYKDPKRGKIGLDGFGRLLDDAGRLDSLRSPIARAAGVKREMTAADSNGDGWVDWAEFSAWFPSFQQQHYTQERNHFYEEKGKEAAEAAAAAAAAAEAAAKAAEEQAAAERAARKQRMIAARAAAKKAWEEARAAAALKARAEAAAAAAGEPDTPPAAAAAAHASAAAGGDGKRSSAAGRDLDALDQQQLEEELKRLELAAARSAADLEAARQRASARLRLGGSGGLPGAGDSGELLEGDSPAGGEVGSSLSSSAGPTAAAGTPAPSPAPGQQQGGGAAAAGLLPNGRLRPGSAGAGGSRTQLDTGRLRQQLQRQALLMEAAAAAAAADSAAAAAAAAEAAAQQLEAEEEAASADAAATAAAAADPDLQRVFAAFAAFGKNSELRGTAATAPLLDIQQFGKLVRDTRLLGGALTLGRADILFTKVAGKGGNKMNWRQFATALPQLARTRGIPADKAMALVASCPGPQLNSELGGSSRQCSFTGRSGSFSGSRPASVAAGSEDGRESLGGGGMPGAGGAGGAGAGGGSTANSSPRDDAGSDGSGGGRLTPRGSSIGGFTPLVRRTASASREGSVGSASGIAPASAPRRSSSGGGGGGGGGGSAGLKSPGKR